MLEAAEAVRRAIEPVLTAPAAGICVALSGGLDSSVLLHVLVRSRIGGLRAVYVNHQLHPEAGAWGEHCERLCADLGVPFITRKVTVETGTGEGLEAAARRARYRALAEVLKPDEVLVTAHHQDDQAETVILNLLRGSGVTGLGGIPRQAKLDGARVLRPLLDVPRSMLLDYARQEALHWVEDPTNTDPHMDRNFLRHKVLPQLQSRWPGLRTTVSRSARLCVEAAQLLDELAALDSRRAQRAGRISLPALRGLSEPRQRNVLRRLCWQELGSVPSESRLREGLDQVLNAQGDRNPVLAWPGGEIRRYRMSLYLLRPMAPAPAVGERLALEARAGARLDLGNGCGRLRLVRVRGQGLATSRAAPVITVKYRSGGEHIRPAGEAHKRELKKLLQERGVVPWMRGRIPLLYCDDVLAAVAGLWVAAEFVAGPAEPGLRVRWDDHPPIV